MKSTTALIVLFLLLINDCFASCVIKCDVKYVIVQNNLPPPTTIQSYNVGTVDGVQLNVFSSPAPQLPLNAMINGATSYSWSNTYSVNVIFYSGSEAIAAGYNYPANAIIALIPWANGGYSVIQIHNYSTQLEVMTEKEISYDSSGDKIKDITGLDADGRGWAIHFDN